MRVVGFVLCWALVVWASSARADDTRTADDPRVTLEVREHTTGDDAWPGEVWAVNRLGGPVEILVGTTATPAPVAEPALPARALLQPFERRLVARLQITPVRDLHARVVPGSPNAKPRDVEYAYPLQARTLRVQQGWGGAHSHGDAENRHAVDFAAEIGTPVLAARAGTIMEVQTGFEHGGTNAEAYAGRANLVRIVHEDGTMAVYAHLKTGDTPVHVGQRVRQGDTIGFAGNTGFSTGPHLHFVVQVNRGLTLHSIPFRMFGPEGILRFSEAVTAPAQASGDAAQ